MNATLHALTVEEIAAVGVAVATTLLLLLLMFFP
jgi:hypothetical protein